MFHTYGIQLPTASSIQHPKGKYIEWFGENDLANEFAMIGMRHFMNAEQESFFFEAAIYDPTMFAPHVCLAEMSLDGSKKQQYHIEEAKKMWWTTMKHPSYLFPSWFILTGIGAISTLQKPMNVKKMHELEPRETSSSNSMCTPWKTMKIYTIINKFIAEAEALMTPMRIYSIFRL